MKSEVFAPAKINLTLHVTGQRADGYHLLDSIVVFADVGDRLFIAPQDHMSLEITGPFADGVPDDARNLVWRAATLAEQTAAITLEKNLPHGGGIGGGSTDAAAMLRHYGQSYGAATLGADVPVCFGARAQRMSGIGEDLTLLPGLPSLHAVLANPGLHVSTPAVFKAMKQRDNPAMQAVLPAFLDAVAFIKWLSAQRNDMQEAAVAIAPEISTVLGALRQCAGLGLARMSGSGSTCFGLFADAEHARGAAKYLAAHHPDWWVRQTVLS